MTEIAKRVEGAKRMAVRQRNYRRARDRALARLANAYPETYKELLEQEKVADVELGKKWVDIDGSTIPAMDLRTYSSITGALGSYPTDNRENEGDSE
jgi:hypothetical protein